MHVVINTVADWDSIGRVTTQTRDRAFQTLGRVFQTLGRALDFLLSLLLSVLKKALGRVFC